MIIIDKEHSVPHKPLVATIGFFDGVHRGHCCLIDQVKQVASRKGLPSAVITFPVHPRKVLQADYQPALLLSYEEKVKHLEATEVDYCVSLDFTVEISRLSAYDFMLLLKERLLVDTLLIGYDHRFGHNRAESFDDYKRYGEEIGIEVIQAQKLSDEHTSSSRIRRFLGQGDVKSAARLLSYNYSISGEVVEGFQVGRTIGFPTANIQIWERYKVVPALGVYAVYAHVNGVRYNAMLYIGKRPTLQANGDISLEVNLFGFDDDLYGKKLTVEFLEFVRSDEKFANIELLKKQITRDKKNVIAVLAKYN